VRAATDAVSSCASFAALSAGRNEVCRTAAEDRITVVSELFAIYTGEGLLVSLPVEVYGDEPYALDNSKRYFESWRDSRAA
jgi:hypothetical protein